MRSRYNFFFGLLLPAAFMLTGCSKPILAELDPIQDKTTAKSEVAKPATQEDQDKKPATATEVPAAEEKPKADAKPAVAKTTEDKKPAKVAETKEAPAPEEKTKAEIAADAKKAAAAEAAKRLADGKKELANLNKEFIAATTEWRKKARAATEETRDAIMKATPSNELGPDYLKLAEKFSGTVVSTNALKAALNRSTGETKDEVSNQLLELAKMDSGTPESQALLTSLGMSGADAAKAKATNILVDLAAKAKDGEGAEILNKILSFRGDSEGKTKAAQMMLDVADEDIRSNKAFDQLSKLTTSVTGEVKSEAFSRLSAYHLDNAKLPAMLVKMGQRPTLDMPTELWLKEVCRKATNGQVKATAGITLSQYLDRRATYKGFYADAEEDVLKNVDKELLAYLAREPNPNEAALVESTLDSYVKGNEKLVESVKKQLFVLQNLSVGKMAPDIIANDLDGVEFKLSDYRGKVVFLDFWGDW